MVKRIIVLMSIVFVVVFSNCSKEKKFTGQDALNAMKDKDFKVAKKIANIVKTVPEPVETIFRKGTFYVLRTKNANYLLKTH